MYGGGMGELGVGRGQIELLAALFHADAPNDVAPSAYNEEDPPGGLPTSPKAVKAGLNRRQIDENVVFSLAATRPDPLTGVDPATGEPAPYGASGVDINCAVIGFTADPPTANLVDPAPESQFPPR